MRVIVCGGRSFNSKAAAFCYLDSIHKLEPIATIIHGGARGADEIAFQWARDRGVNEVVYHADWAKHGRKAGPIRNNEMANSGADLCIAFSGGRGTEHMINMATSKGIEVRRISEDG